MRRKMCVRVCACVCVCVCVPERDHLGHLVQAARLCVGEFLPVRSVDGKNEIKYKMKTREMGES